MQIVSQTKPSQKRNKKVNYTHYTKHLEVNTKTHNIFDGAKFNILVLYYYTGYTSRVCNNYFVGIKLLNQHLL